MSCICPCGTDHAAPVQGAPPVRRQVEIKLSGRDAEISLDGKRIDQFVSGFALGANVREIPSLALELPLVRETGVSLEWANVRIAEDSRDLLTELGWTPPTPKGVE